MKQKNTRPYLLLTEKKAVENMKNNIKKELAAELKKDRPTTGNETRLLIDMLEHDYQFRFNTLIGCTEMKAACGNWHTVDERDLNSLTMEARLKGINVWANETRRYLVSNAISDYNPIDDYLQRVKEKWDGQDHISLLADTVKTKLPQWHAWFRRWLLAVVAQWRGLNPSFGNAVAPVIVGAQGFHKSTFCRQLLPPELQWGYTDGLIIAEKRQMLLAMHQLLLINIDEFNQISRQQQQGFLKNMMQMAVVKAKRPYGKHLEELPRHASFIATSNMSDLLTDPSGSRRFFVVELSAPINTTTPPCHEQLYAQIMNALDSGERYWFDDNESKAIIEHNRKYQQVSPAEQCFIEYYEPTNNEQNGEWLTATTILDNLRRQTRNIIPPDCLLSFGRSLSQMPHLRRKRSNKGTVYLVKRR